MRRYSRTIINSYQIIFAHVVVVVPQQIRGIPNAILSILGPHKISSVGHGSQSEIYLFHYHAIHLHFVCIRGILFFECLLIYIKD